MPHLIVTRIIREHKELDYSETGLSIGQMVDVHLEELMRQPHEHRPEVMEVKIAFDPDTNDFYQYMGRDNTPRKARRA